MAHNNDLKDSDVAAAIKECHAPGSFNYRKFVKTSGLAKKTKSQLNRIFHILDNELHGYVIEEELRFFLQHFDPKARELTTKEIKEFMAAADHDRDGKIGPDDFQKMVHS